MPRKTLLLLRRGANTGPPADLQEGEPFVDTVQRKLYIGTTGSPIALAEAAGGGGGLTSLQATLSSNITLGASHTWFTATSVTLTPGTWLVIGYITFQRSGTGARTYAARLRLGITDVAGAQAYVPSAAPSGTTLALSCLVTVSANSTIYLEGLTTSVTSSEAILATITLGNSTAPATRLLAVRIA